jgi:alpha-D-xyloside xylohydrolase
MKDELLRLKSDTTRFRREGNALEYRGPHEVLRIEPWGEDSLRVRCAPREIGRGAGTALLEPDAATPAAIEIGDGGATVTHGKIRAEIAANGWVRFLNAMSGKVLLEETPAEIIHIPARYFRPTGGDLYEAELSFQPDDDERFYGLGQRRHGRLDQKGCVFELRQANCEISIPFMVSSRGYGFLWHNPGLGRVELGKTTTRWVADGTREIDYWITAGDTPAEILAHYADATGHAPAFPEWASGFWQCKLRYRNQEEILSVAREYKERGLPLSVIVVDFFHWVHMGDLQFDERDWPDPAGMVRELRQMGVEVMVSIWPYLNTESRMYDPLFEAGAMASTRSGVHATKQFFDMEPEGTVYIHLYDPTHPDAKRVFWQGVKEGYYDHGIRIFWLDCNEPELEGKDHENLILHAGPGVETAALYPVEHERLFYEAMREEGQEEVLNLCRSAWAGSQRYGAAIWSGDIKSTFEVLAGQVRAGLNIAMSGIPWWTTDIGGFHSGNPGTPYFRELIVRWFQYGVFCPLFRLHGVREPVGHQRDGGADNEVWSFGEEAYGIITDLLHLRERLRPYVMQQMRIASQTGLPPMRPLFVDFPEDPQAWEVEDAFLFGPDILVAPVVEEGARERGVYLPAGTHWCDAWTGERIEGGRRITAPAPLDRIPVYTRGDAQVPIRGT